MSMYFEELLAEKQSQKFKVLRPAQSAVLGSYYDQHQNTRDLAIELPTGAGKTLIALLVAEHYLKQRKKVAILCGNKLLARQFASEAAAVNTKYVLFEGSKKDYPTLDIINYNRGRAVGIMNYWVYFNANPAIDCADILIMDDAHLAEGNLTSMFSLSVTKRKHADLFRSMVQLLAEKCPHYPVPIDIVEERSFPSDRVDLIGFPDVCRLEASFEALIDASSYSKDTGEDLHFQWRFCKGRLAQSCCLVSEHEIQFRPYTFPSSRLPYWNNPQQRIYLSATMGSADDLQRRLGSGRITKLDDSVSRTAGTGRRLILFDYDHNEGKLAGGIVSTARKSLWMCVSSPEADRWAKALPEKNYKPTWRLSSEGDEIEQFKAASEGHLVAAGRFDGMDFQDNECRVAVLTSLPIATNILERFFGSNFPDASYINARACQRLMQAFGRCNRGPHDYAVYLMYDARFAKFFSLNSVISQFDPVLAGHIDAGIALSKDGHNASVATAQKFLNGDFSDFDAVLEAVMDEDRPDAIVPVETAREEVMGWTALFHDGNFDEAAKHFKDVAQQLEKTSQRLHRAFWYYCAAHAEYLRYLRYNYAPAKTEAVKYLRQASECGQIYPWFNRLKIAISSLTNEVVPVVHMATKEQYYEAAFENWRSWIETNKRWDKAKADIREKLTSGKHDQVAEAIRVVGELLGSRASRPGGKGATDVRWVFNTWASKECYTFELKIDHASSNSISLGDVNQANGQRTRAETEYGAKGYEVYGFLVTHLDEVDPEALSSLGHLRLLRLDDLIQIFDRLWSVLDEFRSLYNVDNSSSLTLSMINALERLPSQRWLSTLAAGPDHWVSGEELLKDWS